MGIETQEMLNLEREIKAYERNKENIIKRFPEGYVAVYEEKVVDNDINWFDLSCRVEEKYNDKPVYVVNVND